MQALLDELGHTALCYYILVEMCAEKLEKKDDGYLTEADCVFTFHKRVVMQSLRIRPVRLQQLLDSCAVAGLFSFSIQSNLIQFKMPILLDLLERNTKKARATRIKNASKVHLDKDVDRDKERDVDVESSESAKLLNKKIWDTYLNAYRQRYKVDPIRNASVNAQVSQLRKRVGERAVELVEFYLSHNDGFYLQKTHALGLCLKDCETLMTQMQRGRAITKTTVRQFERSQEYEETARHIREHGI